MARINFLPRDERFFDLFEEAADNDIKGAEALVRMLGDIQHADVYRHEINELEHKGDSIIHAVMDKLNRTFITPLDAEDIREIASLLDDVIDYTQGAAERIVLYRIKAPLPSVGKLAEVLLQTSKVTAQAIGELRSRMHGKDVLKHCIEINSLENDGDRTYREAVGELLEQGNLKDLICWKEILEEVEEAIDSCEDLADVIESVVVKNA